MTQYTTQMDAARQGIITPQMEIVAEKEHFDVEELRKLIAKGQVIIPCNKNQLLRRYQKLPPQTYIRMSGNDRYCSDLRRSSILSQSTW